MATRPAAADAPPPAGDLRRVIGFWDATALVVGLIIGSGIFRSPASVARHLPDPRWMLAAWVIGGLLSLAGGLGAAELGVRHPRSGGQYVFLRESFGPAVAFTFGWTQVLISKPSVLAGIATVFASYAGGLAGLPESAGKPLAFAAVALLTLVNCLGVRAGTKTQNALTAAKAAGLALVCVGALASGAGDWGRFAAAAPRPAAPPPEHGLAVALALGLVTILYTYDGWIDVTYAGGEILAPRRTLPKAILAGTAACTGLYLLANVAYIYLLPPDEMAGRPNIAVAALDRAFGPAGGIALSLLVIVSTLGILNGSILTGVRVPYAMARDGMLFRFLGRVHPRTLSPVNALVAQGAFAGLVLLFARGFDEIASLFVTTSWLFYAVTLTGLALDRRRADPQEFRMPLSPWPAVFFVVVTLAIVGSELAFGGWRGLAGMAIVVSGVPIYLIWTRLPAARTD